MVFLAHMVRISPGPYGTMYIGYFSFTVRSLAHIVRGPRLCLSGTRFIWALCFVLHSGAVASFRVAIIGPDPTNPPWRQGLIGRLVRQVLRLALPSNIRP